MDYKNNYLLAHIKRQMERELGINRPRVDRHISVKIDVEVYVEERKDLEDLKAALRKERHNDAMNKQVYMLYVHGEPRKQLEKHEIAFFQGVPGFEVRATTMKEIKNNSHKRESKLRRAEWLCSKKHISFDEICELNEMQLHIHRYDRLNHDVKITQDYLKQYASESCINTDEEYASKIFAGAIAYASTVFINRLSLGGAYRNTKNCKEIIECLKQLNDLIKWLEPTFTLVRGNISARRDSKIKNLWKDLWNIFVRKFIIMNIIFIIE